MPCQITLLARVQRRKCILDVFPDFSAHQASLLGQRCHCPGYRVNGLVLFLHDHLMIDFVERGGQLSHASRKQLVRSSPAAPSDSMRPAHLPLHLQPCRFQVAGAGRRKKTWGVK